MTSSVPNLHNMCQNLLENLIGPTIVDTVIYFLQERFSRGWFAQWPISKYQAKKKSRRLFSLLVFFIQELNDCP